MNFKMKMKSFKINTKIYIKLKTKSKWNFFNWINLMTNMKIILWRFNNYIKGFKKRKE